MKRISLIGEWLSPKGDIWHVRKAQNTSNKILNIEFSVETFDKLFEISSDIYRDRKWNYYDSDSFNDLIIERDLKKLEAIN